MVGSSSLQPSLIPAWNRPLLSRKRPRSKGKLNIRPSALLRTQTTTRERLRRLIEQNQIVKRSMSQQLDQLLDVAQGRLSWLQTQLYQHWNPDYGSHNPANQVPHSRPVKYELNMNARWWFWQILWAAVPALMIAFYAEFRAKPALVQYHWQQHLEAVRVALGDEYIQNNLNQIQYDYQRLRQQQKEQQSLLYFVGWPLLQAKLQSYWQDWKSTIHHLATTLTTSDLNKQGTESTTPSPDERASSLSATTTHDGVAGSVPDQSRDLQPQRISPEVSTHSSSSETPHPSASTEVSGSVLHSTNSVEKHVNTIMANDDTLLLQHRLQRLEQQVQEMQEERIREQQQTMDRILHQKPRGSASGVRNHHRGAAGTYQDSTIKATAGTGSTPIPSSLRAENSDNPKMSWLWSFNSLSSSSPSQLPVQPDVTLVSPSPTLLPTSISDGKAGTSTITTHERSSSPINNGIYVAAISSSHNANEIGSDLPKVELSHRQRQQQNEHMDTDYKNKNPARMTSNEQTNVVVGVDTGMNVDLAAINNERNSLSATNGTEPTTTTTTATTTTTTTSPTSTTTQSTAPSLEVSSNAPSSPASRPHQAEMIPSLWRKWW